MSLRRTIAVRAASLACGLCFSIAPAFAASAPKGVLKTYADIAEAAYTDSLDAAKTLKLAVDAFLALVAARAGVAEHLVAHQVRDGRQVETVLERLVAVESN